MKENVRQLIHQARPALLPLAGLCLLLAAVFGWNGIAQLLDNERRSDLAATRDNGIQLVHQAMLRHQKQLTQAIARPGVQAALAAGDLPGAAKSIGADWPNVSMVQIYPADLEVAYANLKSGYGRMSVVDRKSVV